VDRNNTEKPRKDESWLTVNDWVTFLTSEKYGIMSNLLNFSAVFVALIAILFSIRTGSSTQVIANGVVALALVAYAFFKVFRPFEKRGKLAEKTLASIMSGKLRSEESIRKAWEDGLKSPKSR
jgi:hypothetical protein